MKKYLILFLFLPFLINASYIIKPDGNDTLSGLTEDNAWQTLEKANSTMISGDDLRIMSGEYTVASRIRILTPNIRYWGDGDTSILNIPNGFNTDVFRPEAADIILHDFKINGNRANQTSGSSGIETGYYATNFTAYNLSIDGTYDRGILVNGASGPIIHNNTINDTGSYAIEFANCRNFAARNNTITNPILSGIYVAGGTATPYISNNFSITGNEISGVITNETSSIHIWQGMNGEIAYNNLHDNADTLNGVNGIFHHGINGYTNSRIHNNTLTNITGVGIELGGSNYTVEDNTITLNGNGTAAHAFYMGASNTTIKNNTINKATRHGFFFETNPDNILIENNILNAYGTDYDAFRFIGSGGTLSNLTVKNNIILDGEDIGHGAIYSTGNNSFDGVSFEHNTFGNQNSGIELSNTFIGDGFEFQNNIVSLNQNGTMIKVGNGAALDYNIYYNSGGAYNFSYGGEVYTLLSDYQSATSQDQHSIVSDPLINSTGFPYTNSPAIEAGTDVGVTTDYRGVSRSSLYDGDLPDIGAYERKKKQPVYTGQSYGEWNSSISHYRDSQ